MCRRDIIFPITGISWTGVEKIRGLSLLLIYFFDTHVKGIVTIINKKEDGPYCAILPHENYENATNSKESGRMTGWVRTQQCEMGKRGICRGELGDGCANCYWKK